jgi:peptidoglycan hydrolase-like protein with peptidoglycan-binding domain
MTKFHEVTGDHPEIQEYAKGDWVLYAQQLLEKAGFKPADGLIDGLFGENTKNAVTDFQRARGLHKVDGIIGVETWPALEGVPASTTVTGTTISGAGSTGSLDFDQLPSLNQGWMVWSVTNVGSATVGAGTDGGAYEMYDDATSNKITGGSIPLASDLAPGASSGTLGTNLILSTPNDGVYGASVSIGNRVAYIDYRVTGGVVGPK